MKPRQLSPNPALYTLKISLHLKVLLCVTLKKGLRLQYQAENHFEVVTLYVFAILATRTIGGPLLC